MSCGNNSRYAKSCVRSFNDTPQVVTENPTVLAIEGTPVVKSGCSLGLNPSSISVLNSGLYRFATDVIFTPSAATEVIIQLYKDGVPLPCAKAQETCTESNTFTVHIETDLGIALCCGGASSITVVISGCAGTVNHICTGAIKSA